MTWIAPTIERTLTPRTADERPMYQAWLDQHRQTLLWKCSGLNADQLKLRCVAPSSMSLLGLVRHMTEVERGWFRMCAAGEPLDHNYSTEDDPDGDFDNLAESDAEVDFAAFHREIELCDAAVAALPLDHIGDHPRRKTEHYSLRWIYVHMIEEYARHNGHADFLRERIDGSTGL